jgi:Mg2+ and Co2+ transporter CorA
MEVNRVYQVLTVLAPFDASLIITSFYGMNIKHMPNTDWPECISPICLSLPDRHTDPAHLLAAEAEKVDVA